MEGKFIRIGRKVINTELVTDMTIEEDGRIVVHLAAPAGSSTQIRARWTSFEDDESAILLEWIERNAVDLLKNPRGADLVGFV